jgi:hypothetical protein
VELSGQWTCPSCQGTFATAYCSACGEKPIHRRDLTLRGLLLLTYHAFSPVDGRVMRTLRELLLRPGGLTRAFEIGLRKPYIGPFQIFLIMNLVFFAIQSFSEMKVFTNTLDVRLQDDELGSGWSAALVNERLAETGRTYDQYAPVFNQAVAVNAKSLIGLMVIPFAVEALLLLWRKARPLAVHVAFSLHFYAFFLVLLCIPLSVMIVEKMLGGSGRMSQPVDDALTVLLVISCFIYLFFAIGPAYGARGFSRAAHAVVLTALASANFLIYRIMLLPITLYTT